MSAWFKLASVLAWTWIVSQLNQIKNPLLFSIFAPTASEQSSVWPKKRILFAKTGNVSCSRCIKHRHWPKKMLRKSQCDIFLRLHLNANPIIELKPSRLLHITTVYKSKRKCSEPLRILPPVLIQRFWRWRSNHNQM